MPSMEERMTAVERRLRLQDRERAVQRQLFTTAQSDILDRIDDVVTKSDVSALRVDVDVLRTDVNQRIDAVQADVSAILQLLNRKFPPG